MDIKKIGLLSGLPQNHIYMKRFLLYPFLAIAFIVAPFNAHAQLFEDFEDGTKTSYAAAEITLDTGTWMFDDALIGTLAGDKKNGSRSARIRDGFIEMRFNHPSGMSELSFYAANFSNDSGGAVQVSYSTNNGTSWETIGTPITLSSDLTKYEIVEDIPGNIRLRFEKTNGNRINVDDVNIIDFIETNEEPTLVVRVNDVPFTNNALFDFGTTVGESTATLQIRNTGQEELVIHSYEIIGQEFSVSQDLDFTLAPMAFQNVTLTFSSDIPGQFSGSIELETNDPENANYTLNLAGEVLDTSQPIPIAEARELPQGTLVTVGGWVTVASQFRGPVYFQDETGGIGWFNFDLMRENWLVEAEIGDYIVVTGEIGEFNSLLQIVNDSGYEVIEDNFQIQEPVDITLSQLNSGNFESQLVRINDVLFEASGLFSGGTNYDINDGTDEGQLRVDNFTNIAGSSIPNTAAEVTGVAGRFMNTRQLLPRFTNDIKILSGPVITTAPPYEVHATANSITFEWATEQAGHSEIRYGTTPSLEFGEVLDLDPKTNHRLTVSNLPTARTFYFQIRSAVDTDTSSTSVFLASSSSPAGTTGEINVYFNQDAATELATYQVAQDNVNFRDKLISFINAAEQTAEFAFYSISGQPGAAVRDAIIAAHNRGVAVRVIGSGHTGNPNAVITALSNAGVPAVQSLGDEQMHNKFAVIDANHSDPTKSWVITSSWNATDDGTFNQFQNMVNIQDVALARAYLREFNQMWGEDSGPFNPSTAKFSADKSVVNASSFWIGEDSTYVQLYFSPQGSTESHINRALSSAQESIDLNLNLITRRPISNTMLARFNEGVKVRGAIGVITGQGSEWDYLSSWADVHHFPQGEFGLLHHKAAIVDGEVTGPNSKVITGSHNWSGNANFSNDENTLIIQSPRIANEYFQEFAARYWQAGGEDTFNVSVNIDDEDTEIPSRVTLSQNYPNPFNPTTNIAFELPADHQVTLQIYDITGRLVATLMNNQLVHSGTHTVQFDASRLASGMYIYRMQLDNGTALTRKMTLIK